MMAFARNLFIVGLICCWGPGIAKAAIPGPTVSRDAGVTIIMQPSSVAQLTGVALFVRAGLDRQAAAQNGLAALTAESILRTPVSGMVSLQDEINANGGSISYVVEGHDVRFYVEGAANREDALLVLFENALRHPDFSSATISAARNALNTQISYSQQSPLAVGIEMLDQQFYGSASTGLPPSGTPASLAQFVPSDAQEFYERNYRRSGAIVSAVGALAPSASIAGVISMAQLRGLAEVLPAGASTPVAIKVTKVASSSRQLVARRDVTAAWLVAQFPAPALGSRDFAAMLVLDAFIDRTLSDVASLPGVVSHTFADRALGTMYNFDQQPANLIVYVDGGLGDPTRNFATALSVVNLIGAAKLQGSIQEFKTVAQGQYSAQATTLEDRAAIAGIFASQSGSPEYLNRTLAQIGQVTPADLQRVVNKYLKNPTIALILPREGS
jgi:predicted Zn-dependent peptidase